MIYCGVCVTVVLEGGVVAWGMPLQGVAVVCPAEDKGAGGGYGGLVKSVFMGCKVGGGCGVKDDDVDVEKVCKLPSCIRLDGALVAA